MSFQINIPDATLFEDPYIIVLNKPGGLMVEPDRNGHSNLLHQLRKFRKSVIKAGEELYIQHIHRLDRPVSGIILFAKQKAVLRNLSEQFAERSVKKFYQALTEKAPAQTQGELTHWHIKKDKKAIISNEAFFGSEKISLTYVTRLISDIRCLWEIELQTGKYHQIRAQLSAFGCPIIGDQLYGADVPYKPNCIALHAYKLVFAHPISGEEIVIEKHIEF